MLINEYTLPAFHCVGLNNNVFNLNETEFSQLISQVDEILREKSIAIGGRPLNAVIEILHKLHESGPLVTPPSSSLEFPVSALNLSAHVHSWYDSRYGDRLKIDPGICNIPVYIFNVVYECTVPVLIGNHLILAGKEKFDNKSVYNAVDMIKDLSKNVRSELTCEMENAILAIFQTALVVGRELKSQSNELLIAARHDSLTACEYLSGYNKNPSLSAWHSLQFVEKVIKSYISKTSSYPRVHDIKTLKDKAVSLGYQPDPRIQWDLLKISPSVRYEPNAIDIEHSVKICHESWKISFNVLMQ